MSSYHLLTKSAGTMGAPPNPYTPRPSVDWQQAPGLQAPPAADGLGGYLNKNKYALLGGTAAGWAGGAAAGAALGSVVPVVGTAIGGIIGGLAGGLAGDWAGSKLDNAANPAAPAPVTGPASYGAHMLQQGMAENKAR